MQTKLFRLLLLAFIATAPRVVTGFPHRLGRRRRQWLGRSNNNNYLLSDDKRRQVRTRQPRFLWAKKSEDNDYTSPPPPLDDYEEPPLDVKEQQNRLERFGLRLAGLEVYPIVGTLISTSSFGTMKSGSDFLQYNGILVVVGALSCLLSLYASVTFLSTVVYGKTALALEKEAEYFEFMQATQTVRSRAFTALSASLLTFSLQVLMVLGFLLPPSNIRIFVVLGAAAAIGFGFLEWRHVFQAAGPIFGVPKEDEAALLMDQDEAVWKQTNGVTNISASSFVDTSRAAAQPNTKKRD